MKFITTIILFFLFSIGLLSYNPDFVVPINLGNEWYFKSIDSTFYRFKVISGGPSKFKVRKLFLPSYKSIVENWEVDSSRFFMQYIKAYDEEITEDTSWSNGYGYYSIKINKDTILNISTNTQSFNYSWSTEIGESGGRSMVTGNNIGPIQFISASYFSVYRSYSKSDIIGMKLNDVVYGKPHSPLILSAENSNYEMFFKWCKNLEYNLQKYNIYQSLDSSNVSDFEFLTSTADTFLVLKKIKPKQTSYLKITAVNEDNVESDDSEILEFISLVKKPNKPSIIKYENLKYKMYIVWRKNLEINVSEYKVYQGYDPDPNSKFVEIKTVSDTFLNVEKTEPSKPTYLKLTAVNWSNFESDFSEIVEFPALVANEQVNADFRIAQNYPNPFNSSTQFAILINKYCHFTFKIFNVSGEEIKILIDREISPDQLDITWDGTNRNNTKISSGVYFAMASSSTHTEIVKIIYLR